MELKKCFKNISLGLALTIIGLILLPILSIIGGVLIAISLYKLKKEDNNFGKGFILFIIFILSTLAIIISSYFEPSFEIITATEEVDFTQFESFLDIKDLLNPVPLEAYYSVYMNTAFTLVQSVSLVIGVYFISCGYIGYVKKYINVLEDEAKELQSKGKLINILYPFFSTLSQLAVVSSYNVVNQIINSSTEAEMVSSLGSTGLFIIVVSIAELVFFIWYLIRIGKVRALASKLSNIMPVVNTNNDDDIIDIK